jgi:hypothetical protein
MEMDLKALKDTPPWDWPAGMAEELANGLMFFGISKRLS